MAALSKANSYTRRVGLLCALFLIVAVVGHGVAQAQRVTVSGQREIYAGLPFVLNVVAEGFDEEPQPVVEDFEVAGGKVTFVDVSPNISTSISIINGRRSESRRVQYVYRYRVVVDQPGAYRIPAITVSQGGSPGVKKASSQPANFRAMDIATTPNMRIELELPDRPVSVGETFDVAINWYLRAEVTDVDFVVPFFDAPLWMDVHQPQISAYQQRSSALPFTAGDREIQIPYTSSKVTLDGQEFKRVRFDVAVTAIKPGTLEVEPARVVASLKVGEGRDAFGFRTARTRLFKAEDTPRSLQIRPLPAKDRPPSFANAVGTAFSIQVQASRTVVKLGDPVELDIVIRGDGRLEGLSLPPLDNPDGLPPDKFTVLDTPASGEITDGGDDGKGKAKRFVATVRVKSPEVREIPPIAFSYFNPRTGRYDTVRSQPIALSVEGSSIVGAGDVVSAARSPGQETGQPGTPGAGPGGSTHGSLMGADLSLSPPAATLARPWTVATIKPVLFGLYLLPLLMLGARLWQVSTRERRGRSSETRTALREVHRELDRARSAPARDAAPALLAALRGLARATGREQLRGEGVIARIENESYDPRTADEPLSADALTGASKLADELMDEWQRSTSSAAKVSRSAVAVLAPWLVAGALAGAPRAAQAQAEAPAQAPVEASAQAQARNAGAQVTLDAARAAYQQALAESDRTARSNGFARAERMYRELVQATPDRPELLTDWGNAALGAQDLGRATLAYRRALALDAGQTRAARNLAWVRNRAPDWLPVPGGDDGSLFFWHDALSSPARHLIGALAFFAAVMLIVPWGRRQRLLRRLAMLPALVWLAMLASVLMDEPPVHDAVIIADGVAMLSADSPGAPPALANPLPAGAEVTIVESRAPWTRVALADGTRGWVQSSAVAQVLPAAP